MSNLPALDTIALRLADEGVPLRAIARATATPSELVRERLHDALTAGTLLNLPKEDWPPGFPRDQRALQLSRMVVEDRKAVVLAMQQVFGLTVTEVSLLMTLIQNPDVPRDRLNMAPKCVDVHIHNMRKRLSAFGIKIITLWGQGYRLSVEDRRKAMDLILAHVGTLTL